MTNANVIQNFTINTFQRSILKLENTGRQQTRWDFPSTLLIHALSRTCNKHDAVRRIIKDFKKNIIHNKFIVMIVDR